DVTAVLVPGHRHHPAEGLQDHVVARCVLQWSGTTKSRYAAVNQAVVERTKAVGVDGQPLGNAGPKTLDRDVGRSRHLVHERPSLFRLHIDRDASLVAIGAQKHRAKPWRRERRPAAGFIALPDRFDLDDFRTEVAEILGAKRAGQDL